LKYRAIIPSNKPKFIAIEDIIVVKKMEILKNIDVNKYVRYTMDEINKALKDFPLKPKEP
jgi:hypothetical protein